MSDSAASYLLDRLVEMALEIGEERFHGVILKAIETCERRPVLATFRRLAGLNPKLDEHVILAWELVTRIVGRHIGRDGEGNVILRPWLVRLHAQADRFTELPIPYIPEGVSRAVASMGGWSALAESFPVYWGLRFNSFKEVLRLSPEEMTSLTSPTSTALATK